MENEERFQELLQLYLDNRASNEEISELAILSEKTQDETILSVFEQVWEGAGKGEVVLISDEARTMLTAILKTKQPGAVVRLLPVKKLVYSIAAAAVIALGVFVFYKFVYNSKQQPEIAQQQPPVQDVSPGGNRAVLMLADGKTIMLDSAVNGLLAEQGNGKVLKTPDGIRYQAGSAAEILYNTIQTPRGGEYHVVLSDGTEVWLNASSSLRYPTRFDGKERKVELKGEGYFEVAHNPSSPFKVNVNGKEEVEVMGTHFNINAYSDEETINTTLLEGKVKVTAADSKFLSPGQQAKLFTNGKVSVEESVNTDEVIAWKNGQFYFESADLKTILRQVQRWYDIEIVYEAAVSNRKYFAIISRKSTLTEVLKALQANDIKYRIEGKQLIVQGG